MGSSVLECVDSPLKPSRGIVGTPSSWFTSQLFFGYFTPYMKQAREEGSDGVRPDRLPNLWESDNLEYWSQKFVDAARRQWTRPSGPSRCALLETLLKVFGMYFFGTFCTHVVSLLLDRASLSAISQFTKWNEEDFSTMSASERYKGLFHVAALILFQFMGIFVSVQCAFWNDRIALRVQGALLTCLFRRIITPSRSALPAPREPTSNDDDFTEDEVVKKPAQASVYTLLLIDVPGVTRFIEHAIRLSFIPIRLFLAYNALTTHVQGPARRGFLAVIFVVIPILALEIFNGFLRKQLLYRRDIRVDRCHETVAAIRGLRMLGLEDVAAEAIRDARASEMRCRALRMYIHGVTWALSLNLRSISLLSLITAYVMAGTRESKNFVFKASVVMPVLHVVQRFIGPISQLSYNIHSTIECWVSISRYQQHVFGAGDNAKQPLRHSTFANPRLTCRATDYEKEALLVQGETWEHTDPLKGPVIEVSNALFTWDGAFFSLHEGERLLDNPTISGHDSDSFRVAIPELKATRGQCIVLFGSPGGGKTSCVQAMLGEMVRVFGTCRIDRRSGGVGDVSVLGRRGASRKGAVGYCPQTPWLPEGTVRDVILFGRPFDKRRYARVVAACDLLPDFTSWEERDNRIILEGGANLSSGQMARICLARAVYDYPVPMPDIHTLDYRHVGQDGFQGTKAFFLDDAISTSDSVVGSTIFQNLFGSSALLKHAATVVTMDEPSFWFYVSRMQESGIVPSVEFIPMLVCNGYVTKAAPSPLYCLPASINAPSTCGTDVVVADDRCMSALREYTTSGKAPPSSGEKAFSGAIGCSTYWWLLKRANLLVVFMILCLLMQVQVADKAQRFWLAFWSSRPLPDAATPSPHRVFVQTKEVSPPLSPPLPDQFNMSSEPLARSDHHRVTVPSSMAKHSRFPNSLSPSEAPSTSYMDPGGTRATVEETQEEVSKAMTASLDAENLSPPVPIPFRSASEIPDDTPSVAGSSEIPRDAAEVSDGVDGAPQGLTENGLLETESAGEHGPAEMLKSRPIVPIAFNDVTDASSSVSALGTPSRQHEVPFTAQGPGTTFEESQKAFDDVVVRDEALAPSENPRPSVPAFSDVKDVEQRGIVTRNRDATESLVSSNVVRGRKGGRGRKADSVQQLQKPLIPGTAKKGSVDSVVPREASSVLANNMSVSREHDGSQPLHTTDQGNSASRSVASLDITSLGPSVSRDHTSSLPSQKRRRRPESRANAFEKSQHAMMQAPASSSSLSPLLAPGQGEPHNVFQDESLERNQAKDHRRAAGLQDESSYPNVPMGDQSVKAEPLTQDVSGRDNNVTEQPSTLDMAHHPLSGLQTRDDFPPGSDAFKRRLSDNDSDVQNNTAWYFKIFVWICLGGIVCQIIVVALETYAAVKAAIRIHDSMLSVVMKAPFWVYDCIPLGVLLNRFTADMHIVDASPIFALSRFVSSVWATTFVIVSLGILTPWSLILIPFVATYVYFGLYRLYRPAAREIERSRLRALSPLCGNMSEAESGTVIIRAMGCEPHYCQKNLAYTADLLKTFFVRRAIDHWSDTRLRMLALPFSLVNTALPVVFAILGTTAVQNHTLLRWMQPSQFAQAAGFAAIAVSFAIDLPWTIGNLVTVLGDIEASMSSVQRVREIILMKNDANPLNQLTTMPSTERSGLEIVNLEVSYQAIDFTDSKQNNTKEDHFARRAIAPSLRDINVRGSPGQRIGIVGRTGAGKSSLLLSLLGFAPVTKGKLLIDGIPLTSMSQELRRKIIGVLPQTPVALSGWTIRKFLDPENEFCSKSLAAAIDKVGLLPIVAQLPEGIETVIVKEAYQVAGKATPTLHGVRALHESSAIENPQRWMSDSQLRMLSLARLLLHADDYRLVLVDEPPVEQILAEESNTGLVSKHISSLFNEWFPTATIITVAHYASSLGHCDTVWVLSQGKLVAEVPGSSIPSQDALTRLIAGCEEMGI